MFRQVNLQFNTMQSTKLSSDILEEQFGPTSIVVLLDDEDERAILTKADHGNTLLELSRVTFLQKNNQYQAVRNIIKSGTSMGKAFRLLDIPFARQTRSTYQHHLPPPLEEAFGSGKPATIVEVTIVVGKQKELFADIIEIYSPYVNWPGEYGTPNAQTNTHIKALENILTSSQ